MILKTCYLFINSKDSSNEFDKTNSIYFIGDVKSSLLSIQLKN